MIFADIVVDISHEKLDRAFQYIVPEAMEEKIAVGMMVKIPFGRGNRLIFGYVIEITSIPSWEVDKMKEIDSIEENKVPLETELIRLAWFIREHYGATMNQALKTVIPVKQKTKAVESCKVSFSEEYKRDSNKLEELLARCEKKHATARLRLFKELKQQESLDCAEIRNRLKITASLLKELEEQGILTLKRTQIYRNPLKFLEEDGSGELPDLNAEQEQVIEDIIQSDKPVHLIHGITGSGKTRVYIEIVRQAVQEGKQAIVMIPEISLTYQTVQRFFDTFGERVSILHSKLSQGERYDQMEKAKRGDIDIMIGPRSAVFTPFSNLGVIIIDEEHESSYKSDTVPKYHARETAIYRAGMHDAKVILGSATPSVETYYHAMQGDYVLHVLSKRALGTKARVIVSDLREELAAGNKTIFSRELGSLIEDRLKKKEQIMLFINRRGYAGFVNCRSCGEVLKCPHCDVSLTYHGTGDGGKLTCHYCGYTISMPKLCPSCKSKYIALFGTGTEKVEQMVRKCYPAARVLRMDADTTSKKGGHEKIIKAFANREADILIGTQMIVKGHDFPNVTLIGMIAADLSLHAQDYRASERTFQLLTQAAGRAGRKKENGMAVIQTYNPDNFSIQAAANQDYEQFYEKEILYRTLMEYPPVVEMMAVLVTSHSLQECDNMCAKLLRFMEGYPESFAVIGPADAGISKIKDVYRKVIYLKHPQKEKIIALKNYLEKRLETVHSTKNTEVFFDWNPISGY